MFNFAEIRNISQKFAQNCKLTKIPLSKLERTAGGSNALNKQHNKLSVLQQNEQDEEKSKKTEGKKEGSRLKCKPNFTMNTLPDYSNKTETITSTPDDAVIEERQRKVATDVGESEQTTEGKTLEYLTTSDYKRVSPEFLKLLERNKKTLTKSYSEDRHATTKAVLKNETSKISSYLSAETDLMTKTSYDRMTETLFLKSNEYFGAGISKKSEERVTRWKTVKPNDISGLGAKNSLTKINENPTALLINESPFNIESSLEKMYDKSKADLMKKAQRTVDGGSKIETYLQKIKGNMQSMATHDDALSIELPLMKIYDDMAGDPAKKSKQRNTDVTEAKASLIKSNAKISHEVPLDIAPPLEKVYDDIKAKTLKNAKSSQDDASLVKIKEKITPLLSHEAALNIEPPLDKVYEDNKPNALNKIKPCNVGVGEIKTTLADINENKPLSSDEEPLNIEPPLIYDVRKETQSTNAEKSTETAIFKTNACLTTTALKKIKGPVVGNDTKAFPWLNANADESKMPTTRDGCLLSSEMALSKKSKLSRVGRAKPEMQEQAFVESLPSESSWTKLKKNLTSFKQNKLPAETTVRKPAPFASTLQKWKKFKSSDNEDITNTEDKLTADKSKKSKFRESVEKTLDVKAFRTRKTSLTEEGAAIRKKKTNLTEEGETPKGKTDENVKQKSTKRPQSVDREAFKTTPTSANFDKNKQDQALVSGVATPKDSSKSAKPFETRKLSVDKTVDVGQPTQTAKSTKTTDVGQPTQTAKSTGAGKLASEAASKTIKPSTDDKTTPGTSAKKPSEVTKPESSKQATKADVVSTPGATTATEPQKSKRVTSDKTKSKPLSSNVVDAGKNTSEVTSTATSAKKPSEVTKPETPKQPTKAGEQPPSAPLATTAKTTKPEMKKSKRGNAVNSAETSTKQSNEIPSTTKSKETKPIEDTSATATESKQDKPLSKGKSKSKSKLVKSSDSPDENLADTATETAKQLKSSKSSDGSKSKKTIKDATVIVLAENLDFNENISESEEDTFSRKRRVHSVASVVEVAQILLLDKTPTTVKAKQNAAKTEDSDKENAQKTTPSKAVDAAEQSKQTAANATTAEAQVEKKQKPTFVTESVLMLKKPKSPDSMPAASILKKNEKPRRKSQESTTSATKGKTKKRKPPGESDAATKNQADTSTNNLEKKSLQITGQQKAQQATTESKTTADVNTTKTEVGKHEQAAAAGKTQRRSYIRQSVESKGKTSITKTSGPVTAFGKRPSLKHEKIDFRIVHKPIETPRHPEYGFYEPVNIKIADLLANKLKTET